MSMEYRSASQQIYTRTETQRQQSVRDEREEGPVGKQAEMCATALGCGESSPIVCLVPCTGSVYIAFVLARVLAPSFCPFDGSDGRKSIKQSPSAWWLIQQITHNLIMVELRSLGSTFGASASIALEKGQLPSPPQQQEQDRRLSFLIGSFPISLVSTRPTFFLPGSPLSLDRWSFDSLLVHLLIVICLLVDRPME